MHRFAWIAAAIALWFGLTLPDDLAGIDRVSRHVTWVFPSHRIIHIRDWHFVPRDFYIADLERTAGRKFTDDEATFAHDEHLREVIGVQNEQADLLRRLVRRFKLTAIYAEGLTPGGHEAHERTRASLREVEQKLERLSDLHRTIDAGDDPLAREIDDLFVGHRKRVIEHGGACAMLAITGDVELVPLEDDESHDAARPKNGAIDPAALAARHDSIVRRAMASPIAVVVLGASHDLSAAVRRAGGRIEYVTITTPIVRKLMSE